MPKTIALALVLAACSSDDPGPDPGPDAVVTVDATPPDAMLGTCEEVCGAVGSVCIAGQWQCAIASQVIPCFRPEPCE